MRRRFSDFVATEGVLHANRTEDVDLDSGDVLSTNRVLKREINPELPPGFFDRTYNPVQ